MAPFDFDSVTAPFRMQPGLRRMADAQPHLTPLRPGARHLREKLAVLGAHATQALVGMDGYDPGPAFRAVWQVAQREHPGAWQVSEDGVQAPGLGFKVTLADGAIRPTTDAPGCPEAGPCLQALAPHQRAAALFALAFAEDIAIVDAAAGLIPWMGVCLPSHWAPERKVGRSFGEVHAPVADNALLLAAGDRMLKLVSSGERWERFVWSITPHPRLHAHPDRVAADGWAESLRHDNVPGSAHFRTEHQTFIPLPGQPLAAFTIHVEVEPLQSAISTPGRAAAVRAALASMSDAVLAYRGLGQAREPLLHWLDERARSRA